MKRGLALVAAHVLMLVALPAWACTGDCDGDGEVAVNELVKGVNIALELAEVSTCASFDRNDSGTVTIDELVAGVTAALGTCPIDPIFPANYRDTFTEVRDCRLSIEHGGVSIRVLANSIAAQPYQDMADPLPVGSIVIKEEFDGPDCDDDNDLVRWRVMRKESPGFDPADADWHWQWVNADRSVQENDKRTCIGCHVRPACRERDYMCTEGGPRRGTLTQVLGNQPSALVSITGTSPSNVYTVGADPGDGFGPYVLHYDGTRWKRLNTGVTGSDLWWISVTPIDGAYYMAGANGLILRYDPESGEFEKQTTPGTALLYGVWGTANNNIWAVGGDPTDEDGGGVVWHYDGRQWNVDANLSRVRPEGIPTLYKVWGRSETEVYVVGRLGVVFLYDGVRWSQVTNESPRPLFTIHGNDTITAASGGAFDGVIVERDSSEFVNRAPSGLPQVNGIFIPPDGNGVAVGVGGTVALRGENGWEQAEGLNTLRDFHATWVDPEGGIWAVGGELTLELNAGIVAYGGARTIGSEIVQIDPCPPSEMTGPTTVSFANDIAPLLNATGCLGSRCHAGAFPASGYDMRTYERLFKQGSIARTLEACEIVPGDPDASFLFEKLGPSPRFGGQMPTDLPALTAEQIGLIRTWILEGAQNDMAATPTPTGPTPTRTPTLGLTPSATPTTGTTPAAVCVQQGIICTMAGTGQSVFDGDGMPALRTSLYSPFDVAFDAQQRPIIIDWNNLRLRRIDADGHVETIMGKDFEASPVDGALAIDSPMHHSSDMEFDAAGNLYLAGNHASVVFRIDTDGRVRLVAGGEFGSDGDGGPARDAKLMAPFGVFPDTVGGVYIADNAAYNVRYVDADGVINTVAGKAPAGGATILPGYSGDNGPALEAELNGPTRVRLDANGNLYICDTGNHVIRKVDRDGIITTVAGTGTFGYSGDGGPAVEAQLNTPYDVRFGPNGDLYIVDTLNNVIRRVDADGIITTVVGTHDSGFAGDLGDARNCMLKTPIAAEFAPDGSLWIADTFNHRVRRVADFLGGD